MSSNKAPKSFQGSAVPAGRADNGLISVQYVGNPSMSEPNAPGSGFPKYDTSLIELKDLISFFILVSAHKYIHAYKTYIST